MDIVKNWDKVRRDPVAREAYSIITKIFNEKRQMKLLNSTQTDSKPYFRVLSFNCR